MKVWMLNADGEYSVYSGDTNMLDIPYVRNELSYLTGSYEAERIEFMTDYAAANRKGHGAAHIEERFCIELMEVKNDQS
jgi:hypothetical protein